MHTSEKPIDSLLAKTLDSYVTGVVLAAAQRGGGEYLGARGDLGEDTPFFIASATKLYVTAILMQLVDAGKIRVDDAISKYLSGEMIEKIHVFKGKDYSSQITIRDLMAHTSGLPDYFQEKRPDGKTLLNSIIQGKDQKWDLNDVLKASQSIGPLFPPSSGKAHYSDTNYQLLGRIIENVLEVPFSTALNTKIFGPLGLKKTYLYEDESDRRPISLRYKKQPIDLSKSMTSFGPDGGVVSTAQESMTFLRGFFEGRLFHPNHIKMMTQTWRRIFFPLQYGVGISLFRLPRLFSPFKKMPDLVGHSGLSGAFMFYCPEKRTYLTGTVNQIASPQRSFQLMLKVLSTMEP